MPFLSETTKDKILGFKRWSLWQMEEWGWLDGKKLGIYAKKKMRCFKENTLPLKRSFKALLPLVQVHTKELALVFAGI